MIDLQAIASSTIWARYAHEDGQEWWPPRPEEKRTVVAFARVDVNAGLKACVFDDAGRLVFADSLPRFLRLYND